MCIKVPVPSQESEHLCICIRGIKFVLKYLYEARKVNTHVYVLEASNLY